MKLTPQTVEVSLQQVATTLHETNNLVSAITNQPSRISNQFQEALQALQELSEEEHLPIALVGGAATIHHGYPRSTKDIDIVVRAEDFDRIIKVAWKYDIHLVSWNPTGFHELRYKDVPIEVLQEGVFGETRADKAGTPRPDDMGVSQGLGFASLPGWVRMKLVGDRRKDHADIVEVLKVAPPDQIEATDTYLQNLPHLQQIYRQLRKEAETEKTRDTVLPRAR
jgi:hypothetical protein